MESRILVQRKDSGDLLLLKVSESELSRYECPATAGIVVIPAIIPAFKKLTTGCKQTTDFGE
jgi:hypothetical protein